MEKNISKNILFVSSLQLFPAESGGQLRSANICTALANKGHKVTIYSFTGRKKDYFKTKNKIRAISYNLKEIINYSYIYAFMQFISYKLNLPPIWITFLLKIFIPKELKSLIHNTDLVILDFPFLYPLKTYSNTEFLLNTHNAEFTFQKQDSIYRRLMRKLVKRIEHNSFRSIDKVILCSKGDSDVFLNHDININQPYYISNGVNIKDFLPCKTKKVDARKKYNISQNTNVILFTGSKFEPNKLAFSFLKDFTKRYDKELKSLDITFIVAGTVSNEAYTKGRLIVTGRVESIFTYFTMSDFAINPITTGSGTNVKMMEYLAAYLPILTTEYGSRGVDLTDKSSCYKFNFENLIDIIHEIFTNIDKKDLQLVAKKAYKDNLKYFDINEAIKSLNFL